MEETEHTNKIKALPEKLPAPTYAPFFVAMGIAFIFWGLISSFIISIAGAITFFFGLSIWIKNLLDEYE